MRAVVQRVSCAHVDADGRTTGRIGPGLLVLLGVEQGDTDADLEYIAGKVAELRIFSDEQGKMNLSVAQAEERSCSYRSYAGGRRAKGKT